MYRAVLLAAILAAVPGRALADVDQFLGKPVTGVHVEVEGRPLNDRAVVDLIETHVGDALSMRAVRESITRTATSDRPVRSAICFVARPST